MTAWGRTALHGMAGVAGALLIRILGASVRIRDEDRARLEAARRESGRVIFALCHGQILLGTYLARRERVVSIISRHRDGEIVYQIARRLGIRAVRGSSTRGGAEAAHRLLTDPAFRDLDIVVTPDGPRGPAGRVKPGVVRLARRAGLPIVPVAIESAAPWTFGSWDRFRVPKPFSRGVLLIGPPIRVRRDAGPGDVESARSALESALRELNREAGRRLRRDPWGGRGVDGEVIRLGGWRGAGARYLFRERERWETLPLTLVLLPLERLHRGVRVLLRRSSPAPRRLPVPVISVGNLSVGGTGKTPMAAWLARRLSGKGYRVAILTHGYGGERGAAVERVAAGASPGSVGDEAFLLARALPDCVVYRGRDRYLAGLAAVARYGCDVCILDDGFQHTRLHRDIDIVLLHAERPFGTGWLLPAGPLREGPEALRRADLIVLCRRWGGKGDGDGPAAGGLPRGVARMRGCLVARRLRVLGPDAGEVPPEEIRGKRLLAFAGVGDPRSFLAVVERYAPEAVRFLVFPDHHAYPPASVDRIRRESDRWGAEGLITTEKDAVKLDAGAFDGRPCYVPGVAFAPERGEAALEDLLAMLDVRRGGAGGSSEGGAGP